MDGATENADETFEAFIISRHQVEHEQNPDISCVDHVVLKDGPKSFKAASHFIIVDRNTGEVHHHALKLETFRRQQGSWTKIDVRSIMLDNEREDQIGRLLSFLRAIENLPELEDRYAIVSTSTSGLDSGELLNLLNELSDHGVANVITEMLERSQGNADVLRAIVERAANNPEASREAAAALNLARFADAVERLERLIDDDAAERVFQSLLQDNAWMFGSEYSELLSRRNWTRDEQLDFMLRRTADGYLEVIEIKRSLNGTDLFIADESHDGAYYPRKELSAVIGQVMNYLERLDASRNDIVARDHEGVNKIRAKVIIGRDGDVKQIEALRRLNGHLHRIEILTFDQLLRIARQVVSYLTDIIEPNQKAEE